MRLRRLVAGSLILAPVGYLFAWPTPVEPKSWRPPPAPPTDTGFYALNDALRSIERIGQVGLTGPEYVEIDEHARLYAGYAGGSIMRFAPDGADPVELANTGGRPVGLRLTRDGGLIVADADRGLLRLTPDGTVSVLVDQHEGQRFKLVDDCAITADGATVFFTEASSKFDSDHYELDLLEHGGHGRLLRYDVPTGRTTVLLTGLQFANGLALGPDERYLLVTETGSYRIWRYWLAGERAGQADIFADYLPGFPDNITFNGRDRFWVALAGPRMPVLDRLADKPFLRKVAARVPPRLRPKPPRHAIALAFDTEGRLAANLQYRGPDVYTPMTTVREHGEWLYFGSIAETAIGRMPLPVAL
jgi:sugar lactone lactonase YvrE